MGFRHTCGWLPENVTGEMIENDYQTAVQACYSTWSGTYYDDYYGAKASYPPVHRDLLKRVLREAGAQTLLDAGCGPASFLRELTDSGMDLYGFDLTPQMVEEARRVMGAYGFPESHFWEGSVTRRESFRPAQNEGGLYDAAICVGVFPHIPAEMDSTAIGNLKSVVRPKGLVIVEARNELFGLFSLNRYSSALFEQRLIQVERLKANAPEESANIDAAISALRERFRMDLPPVRGGKAGEPGYDEVLSRFHNPFELRELLAQQGLGDIRLLFYHYHALPPQLAPWAPKLFLEESLRREDPQDWRGFFMASVFFVVGKVS